MIVESIAFAIRAVSMIAARPVKGARLTIRLFLGAAHIFSLSPCVVPP